MKTYKQAVELADAETKEVCSTAGGWRRYLTWSLDFGGKPIASIYGNVVATFHEYTDGRTIAKINTCGFNTPSTFDAISAALDIPRGHTTCGTVDWVPHVLGVGFASWANVDLATGTVIAHD